MRVIRPAIVFFVVLFSIILVSLIELYFIKMPSLSITIKLVLIALFTFNVVAFITLMFFVGKNLYNLYVEAKNKAPGYKFKTRLMTVFLILTLIPSAFLFITASGLATNYINNIFSPAMKEPLKKSIELAKEFYDYEKNLTLQIAKLAANGKITKLPQNISLRVSKKISAGDPDCVKDAFKGISSVEIVSKTTGDIVVAAVPIPQGALIVEHVLPLSFSQKSNLIKELYEDSLKVEAFKNPLNLNFILILGFATLIMVFAGLWVSLKISKSITVPIEDLAKATTQVAEGNLDITLQVTSKDEIGMLTQSFNNMVVELRESKSSLEKAYSDVATKRLYLENILQNIKSGVVLFDNLGKVITMNRSAMNMFALTHENLKEADYRKLVEIAQSQDLEALVNSIQGKFVGSISQEIKVEINGRKFIYEIYIVGIRQSDDSKSDGILVVLNDITETVRAQKIIAWQEVARRMAHEIKNPLTPIRLSAERALKKWKNKDEDFDAVIEKSFKTIIHETEMLKNLVDEFARYGRLPELQMQTTDINALMENVVALYKGYPEVQFHLQLSHEFKAMSIDPEQFRRALINIIDNALRAIKNKGMISISSCVESNKLIIKIADNGDGISDDVKEKLFLPYFSKSKGGTGLGLAITHRIIKEHGGNIYALDNKPIGAVFVIELPINQAVS